MESSANFEGDMELLKGHSYKFMMMTGQVLEGIVTDPFGAYETFHVQIGRATRQYYYWDVDYAYPLEERR